MSTWHWPRWASLLRSSAGANGADYAQSENSDFEWRMSQMQQTSININKRRKCINPHALGTRECASVCLNSLHQSEGWSSHGTTARHWSQRWWWKWIYVIHWMRLQGRLGVLKLCPLRHFSGSKTSFQWAVSCWTDQLQRHLNYLHWSNWPLTNPWQWLGATCYFEGLRFTWAHLTWL